MSKKSSLSDESSWIDTSGQSIFKPATLRTTLQTEEGNLHADLKLQRDQLLLKRLVEESSRIPPRLTTCLTSAPSHGPACLGLVTILSRIQASKRRDIIRATWLSRLPGPGLDFIFLMASSISPKRYKEHRPRATSNSSLLERRYRRAGVDLLATATAASRQAPRSVSSHFDVLQLLREYKRHGDLMLMNTSEDGNLPKHMLHAWQWSVNMSRGRYLFLVKAEDDDVINPYQLRLTLSLLPRNRPVFWGRKLTYRHSHAGCAGGKMGGALMVMSHTLAARMANLTQSEFREPVLACSRLGVCRTCGDDTESAYIHSIFADQHWINAGACQVYNDPKLSSFEKEKYSSHTMWKCGPEYSKETVAVHRVKKVEQQRIAYNGIRPFITAMSRDCDGMWQKQGPAHDGVISTLSEFASSLLALRFGSASSDSRNVSSASENADVTADSSSYSTINYTRVPDEQCLRWADLQR
ncbi:hypothetical protein CEUSTIGMA_g6568.t1 [Chlamydomonas eustigma]|uniref:Hexosyltransferase n=1 Tax=Chlamydomonas eustigma TaxID=1157962 RepID=A0A250X7R9_9CHLO|nr:hypothetical protein CEUSTIGMA_g6568.t1 [Chlamydomonas eustigma]|eukprot:GAX79128.1 hypothetical protein CEUSTIGMA_g6568.t1 [Chlamydomonas eustigma]